MTKPFSMRSKREYAENAKSFFVEAAHDSSLYPAAGVSLLRVVFPDLRGLKRGRVARCAFCHPAGRIAQAAFRRALAACRAPVARRRRRFHRLRALRAQLFVA